MRTASLCSPLTESSAENCTSCIRSDAATVGRGRGMFHLPTKHNYCHISSHVWLDSGVLVPGFEIPLGLQSILYLSITFTCRLHKAM